jgi:hypothetical protein
MNSTREQIYSTLFDMVVKAVGSLVKTTSRRPDIFSNLTPAMQPALFMEQIHQNPIRKGIGMPYYWELDVNFIIYAYAPNTGIAPDTLLNPILDAIENAIPPATLRGVSQAQTLGGLVSEVRLLEKGGEASGSLVNQAWAFVPVRISTF